MVFKRLAVRSSAAVLIFAFGLSLFGCSSKDPEQKTLDSFTKAADGIYTLDCYSDYKIDEYLKAGITDVLQYDTWMTENLTHGVPTGDIPGMGCSSFVVESSDGGHLFGRNYDSSEGDALVIRTHPENGYASIGIADLKHVNLGVGGEFAIEDEASLPLLFAAPWCVCDGINEKGLGVSLLELSDRHVVIDTEKEDFLIYSAVRVLLDKCANIDEALALLACYDMYSPRKNSYHVFITDTSGRSVIAEWTSEGLMVTEEDTAVANFLLCKNDPYLDYDHRYSKMHASIDGVSSMSSDEAMGVLSDVSQYTRWSAVYNLEKFTVDICFSEDYSKTYSYNGKK